MHFQFICELNIKKKLWGRKLANTFILLILMVVINVRNRIATALNAIPLTKATLNQSSKGGTKPVCYRAEP